MAEDELKNPLLAPEAVLTAWAGALYYFQKVGSQEFSEDDHVLNERTTSPSLQHGEEQPVGNQKAHRRTRKSGDVLFAIGERKCSDGRSALRLRSQALRPDEKAQV